MSKFVVVVHEARFVSEWSQSARVPEELRGAKVGSYVAIYLHLPAKIEKL